MDTRAAGYWNNEPVIHARRDAKTHTLCGLAPGSGQWTTRRSEVTCSRCVVEIERRLEVRRSRR